MSESRSRLLSVVRPCRPRPGGGRVPADGLLLEPGLADVVTLQRRRAAEVSDGDERSFFVDTLAEYQWARDAAGLAATTLDRLTKPVLEICEHYGLVAWRLTPRQVDQYFAGAGQARPVDGAAEDEHHRQLLRVPGAAVCRGDRPPLRGGRRVAGRRVQPSPPPRRLRAAGAAVAAGGPRVLRPLAGLAGQARKPLIARRDYVMGKLTYISGVRAAELCGVRIGDLHWESGQWGRFLVNGKGARGSGPRPREAYMFEEGRDLLWWWVEEVRGDFTDDPGHPDAPLFPSERIPAAVSALNVTGPGIAVTPSTFRRALKVAGDRFLAGPVPTSTPTCSGTPRRRTTTSAGCRCGRCRRCSAMTAHDHGLVPGDRPRRPGGGQPRRGRAGGAATDDGQGEPAVKWNLRWAAAKRDIWRPSDLLKAFEEVGFTPSLSKVAALWSGKPISVRLDDLDKMCAALGCTVADLLEAEPLAATDGEQEQVKRAVGAGDEPARPARPVPRRGGPRRSLPPN